MVFMTQAADHVTGLTGATLTITLSKDGAAFGGISPTVTERGSGWYLVALAGADTDTQGDIVLHVTAAGGDPTDIRGQVFAKVPGDAVALEADAITSAQLSADAIVEIQAGLALSTQVDTLEAGIATILTFTDVATSTRLATASYTVPDNAGIAAIQAKTDQLTFFVANRVDVNVLLMNSATVLGTGTAGDLWRG